jgi:Mn2+/Fe2+ NRAMP family transporter
MVRFLKGLVLLPVAILVVLLAVANREAVRVSFDPFSPEMPVFSATLPLYAILFIAVAVGIVVGGIGAWLGQGGTRRTARLRHREIRRLEGETARLRATAPEAEPAGGRSGLPATLSTTLPAPR